jgi:hypothetical protein
MSFNNANIFIQQFVSNYGNTTRTYKALDYVRDVSNANQSVNLTPDSMIFSGGKKRIVRLNYFPILCDVEGDCSTQTLCSTGDAIEPHQQQFEITRCTATKVFKINKDDIRMVDNGAWDFTGTAKQIIASAMPAARRLLAIDWVTRLYELAGVHPDGNATHRISVTNPASGIVNPIGRFQIEREYMDAGFSSPYIMGGEEVFNWQSMVAIGGLNAQGQRIDQLSTARAYYDDGLSDSILNDLTNGGHIITIAPETFKYVFFLENAGIFRTDMASINDLDMLYKRNFPGFLEGTLIDPVTGIAWDLFIRYDECARTWNFWMKHEWDFFVMPDVACNAEGVNGIMHYRTCPPVIAACPTGDTPSPALAEVTFGANPTITYPYTVYNSNIGGVEVTQNVGVELANDTELAEFMTANSSITFEVNGSDLEYDGYVAITATLNGGDVTMNFAP